MQMLNTFSSPAATSTVVPGKASPRAVRKWTKEEVSYLTNILTVMGAQFIFLYNKN